MAVSKSLMVLKKKESALPFCMQTFFGALYDVHVCVVAIKRVKSDVAYANESNLVYMRTYRGSIRIYKGLKWST